MSIPDQDRAATDGNNRNSSVIHLPLLSLVFLRLSILAVLPFEALVAYGDYRHFFEMARLSAEGGGLPFIGHWIEFPPVFPFLSIGIDRLAGGQFHSYVYLLGILMLLFDAANLWIFSKLAIRIAGEARANRMTWLYMVFLAIPAFGWWTFEPMAIFFMLLSLWLVLERKPLMAGLTAGLGFLTKIFPVISLAVTWRFRAKRSALIATAVAVLLAVAVLGTLLALNPTMAGASLRSQISKGSWETVWALIDGNPGTGTFGPAAYRLDPMYAEQGTGNPPVVPVWIPTLVAALFVIWFIFRTDRAAESKVIPYLITLWCVLLLWSRGWSPQWVAYLVPLILLCFPIRRSMAFTGGLVMVSLLEWPILLSRGLFSMLWLPIVVRTILILLLGWECARMAIRGAKQKRARS
jgi:hypothetical protein